MPSLGNLFYTIGLQDLTDKDLQKINDKLKNVGSELRITPKLAKSVNEILPKGVKIELDPQLKAVSNEALAKAVEGKVMKVEIAPLLTSLRKNIADATKGNPAEVEVGVQSAKLRTLIESVLNKQGFMINISAVNDNYTKVVQQKLNGTRYTVKIHADVREIAQSVQTSLMQMQSRYFGLKVSRDVLYRSIDDALGQHRFPINIVVNQDQARQAVQNALAQAQSTGKTKNVTAQDVKNAQSAINGLANAQSKAASATKLHASTSIELGTALGHNIKISRELGAAMTSMYSLSAAKQFLAQVVEIGGELEHQKIAMDTIFGDKGKTNELFGQIKGLARNSPFGVMELSKSVKALSAYGVEYNEIFDTAKRLADISAATSVDINRLILAFGKTKSRTFLDGLEAKQFAYANIPIYDLLSKKLTELEGRFVSIGEVMERQKKREIGFDLVKGVLWDITDPGGKFYNMQEALAGSVKTSWKLVRDNIELMFGEIAESSIGGGLKDLAGVLQEVTQNWRVLSKIAMGAAAAFGLCRLATFALNQVIQTSTTQTYKNLVAGKQEEMQRLRSLSLTQQLTAAEKAKLLTATSLSKAELARAVRNEQLNLAQIEQLYLTKMIDRESVIYLFRLGLIDKATAKNILSTNSWMIRLKGLGATLAGVGRTLKTFATSGSTWFMAGFAAIAGIASHLSEQSRQAEELGDALTTKAAEGAKNLTNALQNLNTEFSNMDSTQLKQAIESLENLIKDYDVEAKKTLFYSNTNYVGGLRSTEQRAEYLKEQAEILQKAYAQFQDWKVANMVERSVDTSNFWGFNWDGLQEDLDDYVDAVEQRHKTIVEYLAEHRDDAELVVKFAADIDPAFAELTKGMGVEQAFTALTKNFGLYVSAIQQTRNVKWDIAIVPSATFTTERQSLNEALKETEKAIKTLKTSLLTIDADFFNPVNMTPDRIKMLGMAYQEMFKNIENLDMEQQMFFVDKWNKEMGTKFDPSFIEGQIQTQFTNMIGELGEDLARKVRNGHALEDAEKEKVKELFDKAVESVKQTWPGRAAEIQDIVNRHPVYANVLVAVNKLGMDDWKKELDDAFGNNTDITATLKVAADTQSAFKALAELKKTAKDSIKKFALAFNITPNFGNLEEKAHGGEAVGSLKYQQIEEYNKFVRQWNGLLAGEKELGINLSDWENSNNSTKKEDAFAKSLKQRLKDIQDAWKALQDWSKTEGKSAAFERIANSGLFSTLSEEEIPKTVEEYRALVEKLKAELEKAGVKGTEREGLLNNLINQLLTIDKSVVDEAFKKANEEVSKAAERELTNWNIFDKVSKATGNQELAMSLAFGIEGKGETDYVSMIKKQFDAVAKANKREDITFDTATPEMLKDAPDAVKKSWEKSNESILKYFDQQRDAIVSILNEYKTLSDSIDAINAKRDNALRIINAKDENGNYLLSEDERTKRENVVNVQADYDIFTKSNDYLRFFNDIYGLTMDEANRIGDLIQYNLNTKLQAGLITIYDYEKEMEKVRKQLESMRNIKSDALTFLTGGVKGLFDKRINKEEGNLANNSEYQNALKKQVELQNKLNKAREDGDEQAVENYEKLIEENKSLLSSFTAVRDMLIKDKEAAENLLSVANMASNIANGMSKAFKSIRTMAESLGVDTDSGAWDDIEAVFDTLTAVTGGIQTIVQSAMSGDVGGILSGAVDLITSPFTIWSQLHDKKLQKMIDRSKEAAQVMQNQYDILEKQMANFLGNAAKMTVEGYTGEGGAYGAQKELLEGQLAELQKQRGLEEDKKNTDDDAIRDYDKQIADLQIQISNFAEEAANAIYGIDLAGWAEQLGDSLVDAFAAGEDAAKAFDKTVGDIMRDVTSKMISQDILAPMFNDLRDYLFGKDGVNGAFNDDYQLSPQEAAKMKEYIDRIKTQGIPAAQELYDKIDEATGGILSDSSASSSLSAGIQSITENTADILASYVNAVRADVSLQTNVHWPRLLNEALPQINIIAQSQLDCQRRIAEYTQRNAVAAEAIVKSNEDISRLLVRATNGGTSFYVK